MPEGLTLDQGVYLLAMVFRYAVDLAVLGWVYAAARGRV